MTCLFDYWQDYPPTHILVGAYLSGGKKTRFDKTKAQDRKSSFDQLNQAVVGAGGAVHQKLPNIYKV